MSFVNTIFRASRCVNHRCKKDSHAVQPVRKKKKKLVSRKKAHVLKVVVLIVNLYNRGKFRADMYSTYLLAPWCRDLLEQLTGLQLVKKFPAFHGTRRFINALTSVRRLSLSWASPIQSIYPHPTFWRSILILSTHLRLGLPSGLLLTYSLHCSESFLRS